MKSITAAYWLPVAIERPGSSPPQYTGYNGQDIPDLDDFIHAALGDLKAAYGTIVNAHYIVEGIEPENSNVWWAHCHIVVTTIVEGEVHADRLVYQDFQHDLREFIEENYPDSSDSMVKGYDSNTIEREPVFTKYQE